MMRARLPEHGTSTATMCFPTLLAHRYFGDFKVLPFLGFAEPHSLELDLGDPYDGRPLWLLMHGEIEYYSANSMYAADQAGLRPFAPYVEALVEDGISVPERDVKPTRTQEKWLRVIDDLGFPAGGPRTMTADLTGKLPLGTRRIRLTTNLQIYWDNILISRTDQNQTVRLTPVPLVQRATWFPRLPAEDRRHAAGQRELHLRAGQRYRSLHAACGCLYPLWRCAAARLGAGRQVCGFWFRRRNRARLRSRNPARASAGWVRDYFFIANGYEKDMDFYAYHGDTVDPLPFADMKSYPYTEQTYPADADHLNYLLEYNTRFMSGSEPRGYSFQYPDRH